MVLDIFSINSECFIAVSLWDFKPSIAADLHTFDAEVAVYKFSGSTFNLFQVIRTFDIPYVFDMYHVSSLSPIVDGNTPQQLTIDLYKWNDGSNI